jgi:hypothetical protein
MQGFVEAEVIARSERFVISRRPHVLAVELIGQLKPADVDAWLGAVKGDIERNGYPHFVAVDLHRLSPVDSMAARFRVASFARSTLPKVRWLAIFAKPNTAAQLVARVVIRIAGVSNVSVHERDEDFHAVVEKFCVGLSPAP